MFQKQFYYMLSSASFSFGNNDSPQRQLQQICFGNNDSPQRQLQQVFLLASVCKRATEAASAYL